MPMHALGEIIGGAVAGDRYGWQGVSAGGNFGEMGFYLGYDSSYSLFGLPQPEWRCSGMGHSRCARGEFFFFAVVVFSENEALWRHSTTWGIMNKRDELWKEKKSESMPFATPDVEDKDKRGSFLIRGLLNEKFIMIVICINAIIIFWQESAGANLVLSAFDILCTVIFVGEMIAKQITRGFINYWKNGFNRFDGLLVLLSLPSLAMYVLPGTLPDLSFLLVLRMFRVFRFFRLVRLFPGIDVIFRNFFLALRQSYGIMLSYLVIVLAFALISCCMFSSASPEYFGTPWTSIYTIFRLFTIEGWYEIPDAVAEGMSAPFAASLVRVYFSFLLIGGGIIGMSLINSIFVDAMVSDNNDDVKAQLSEMEAKLDTLTKLLAEKQNCRE